MPTPLETFTVRTTAAGGTWSRRVRPSPLASLGLILAGLVALPIAILLVGLAIVLVLLLALVGTVVLGLRRLAATFAGGTRRPGAADAEGRVNVRVRRPDA